MSKNIHFSSKLSADLEQTLVNCISQLFSLYTSSIETLRAEVLKDVDPMSLAEEEVKQLMVEDPKF